MVDFFSVEISKGMLFGKVNPTDLLTAEDEKKVKENNANEEIRRRKLMQNHEIQRDRVDEAQAFEEMRRYDHNQQQYSGCRPRGRISHSSPRVGRGRARRAMRQDDAEVPLVVREQRVHHGISQLTPQVESSLHNNNVQRMIWHGDNSDRSRELQRASVQHLDEQRDSPTESDTSRSADAYEDALTNPSPHSNSSSTCGPFESTSHSRSSSISSKSPAAVQNVTADKEMFPPLQAPSQPIRPRIRIAANFSNKMQDEDPVSQTAISRN